MRRLLTHRAGSLAGVASLLLASACSAAHTTQKPAEVVAPVQPAAVQSVRAQAVAPRADSATMTPLFFLNGVRITQEKMQQIPKESIASVEVLKGKTAIDKYGADAIGGVVLIVTK